MGDGAVATPTRHLRLPGTRNLRDVGGYPAGPGRRTRWRTLLRTDALDRLPGESQETLLAMGIRVVIDLRWPHELVETPSVFEGSDRVTYRSIPLLDDDLTPHQGLAGMYRHILDERTEELISIVRTLLEPGGLPAVIGCAAGKDRTGVAVALLLSAVGVPADVVVDDYTLSGAAFAVGGEDEHLDDWRLRPIWVECPPEYMQAMLKHLEHRHGGASSLLLRNGITAAQHARLVDLLTEPVA